MTGAAAVRLASVARRTGRVGALWLFWLAPAVIAFQLIEHSIELGSFGFDFRGTVWDGGRALLDGRSPYPAPETLQPIPALLGSPFVYPPVILWLAVPFAAVPAAVSEVIWAVCLCAGMVGALVLLGVRDWRCFGIALLSVPVLQGVIAGNVTLLLVLLAAVAWRERDHRWRGAAAIGIAVALKLFLWPLVVWLLATRRFRSAALATGIAAATVAVSWALIGFQGVSDYPALLRIVDQAYAFRFISVSALSVSLGAPEQLAHALQYMVGLALVVAGATLATRADGDRRSFSVIVAATFVLTPIVWSQNLALLFMPIALQRPRFHGLWLTAWAALWFDALALHEPDTLGGGGPMLLRCVVILGFVAVALAATGTSSLRDRKIPPVGLAPS